MTLVANWRAVLSRAWSVRFLALAFLFSMAEIALPAFDGVLPIPPRAFLDAPLSVQASLTSGAYNFGVGAALRSTAARRIAEIKADMMRADLTALDHAVYVSAWCDIFRAAQGPQKRGPKTKAPTTDAELDEFSAKLALNWTEAAQQALGIGRRTVFRSLRVAGIAPAQRSRIALHPIASKQTELLLLADQSEARQVEIIDMLAAVPAFATSVTEAIARLDSVPTPQPVPAYARLYEKFSAFKPADQIAFFEMNADRIEAWLAERRSTSQRKAG